MWNIAKLNIGDQFWHLLGFYIKSSLILMHPCQSSGRPGFQVVHFQVPLLKCKGVPSNQKMRVISVRSISVAALTLSKFQKATESSAVRWGSTVSKSPSFPPILALKQLSNLLLRSSSFTLLFLNSSCKDPTRPPWVPWFQLSLISLTRLKP